MSDRVLAGRYELVELLDERDGTRTWRALDQALSRAVLVHELSAGPRTSEVLGAARQAAQATDSRFVRVLDASPAQGTDPAFVVAEYAPGRRLAELLHDGPLSALESAWLVREVADAMQPLHAQGLFHQRIDPDAILVTATGNVKVMGLLVEAALTHDDAEYRMTWAAKERNDVLALGKVLYACLVARWPTDPGHRTETHGLPPAPADADGWLTPRQVRAGVSPALDVITDQLLEDSPRHGNPPIRSCAELATALSGILGTASAATDLERRMRGTDTVPVMPAADAVDRRDDAIETVQFDPNDDPTVFQPPLPLEDPPTRVQPPLARHATGPEDRPADADDDGGQRPMPQRWLAILVGVVAAVIVVNLAIAMTKSPGKGGGKDPADTPSATAAYAINGMDDFDPEADGGNGEENPNQLANAHDGKTTTAWQTLTYLNNPKMGGLKPGVGVVVDLGTAKLIGKVQLILSGGATSVQVMVPQDATARSDTGKAPMDTVKSWQTVSSNAAANGTVELVPTAPVTSRFLLVYFTQLPKVSASRYQATLAEVSVWS